MIDSRDVIARIEELHAIATDETADRNELRMLQALQDEVEVYAPDWKYGATLIRDSYFMDYCRNFSRTSATCLGALVVHRD